MIKLAFRNLWQHKLRSLLTVGSLAVALFTLCALRSIVTTLEAGLENANSSRLWVQSAVSLFVDLPLRYEAQISNVQGVETVCKWQWFGGYYQDQSNFFAQFACDMDELLAIYPEIELVEGSKQGLMDNRIGCIVGQKLAEQFGWKVGDQIPIIGALFPQPGGEAWQFKLEAIYVPTSSSVDDRTMFFHWKYLEEALRAIFDEPPGVGTFVLKMAPGANATQIMSEVDKLYENGPQRVQTTTEAEFQRQFISMIGNVPRLVGTIGLGVLLAILLACTNTMLMAGREQVRSIGILKALGFNDRSMMLLMLGQSMLLCGIGGGLGVGMALAVEKGIGSAIDRFFPGYAVRTETIVLAVVVTLVVGLIAGAMPAWNASRKRCVEALRMGV